MISRIQLIRNIGRFENVSTGAQLPFGKFALIYAENGRGKTTASSILRSLATGNADLVLERHRLGAANAPHVVIEKDNGGGTVQFQNSVWTETIPDICIFDDQFVAENICAGIEIESSHRQSLHEFIIGATGVALSNELQSIVDDIEAHNRQLRQLGNEIPSGVRGGLNIDEFCALENRDDIDAALTEAEQSLSAARSSDAIQHRDGFPVPSMPEIDGAQVNALLSMSVDGLHTDAAERVQDHFRALGTGGEAWAGDGVSRLGSVAESYAGDTCPFCTQDLGSSPIIEHYRAYFGDAYNALKSQIVELASEVEAQHGPEAQAAFERTVRQIQEAHEFWKAFTDVPQVAIDAVAVVRQWKAARLEVEAALAQKKGTPLEQAQLSQSAKDAISAYEDTRKSVMETVAMIPEVNARIERVKESAAIADSANMERDLNHIRTTKTRYEPETAAKVDAYLEEKTRKTATEHRRDAARIALDDYRDRIFPEYQNSINDFLRRFNAGFRLGDVRSITTRGGASCNYSVIIDDQEVQLNRPAGQPSFRTTLSAGDRNTLALAFFFSSLDRRPNLGDAIVVIDDPMTSLDEHRRLATIHQMRAMGDRVTQIIVFSHSKPFLADVWNEANRTSRSAAQIIRDAGANRSTFAEWHISEDCITMHDRRHRTVKSYLENGPAAADEREVAQSLRPLLEGYLRVAFPSEFPAGSLIGPFIDVCRGRVGQANQMLDQPNIDELQQLKDYGNRFHHDSNAAWQTEIINSQELESFAGRVIAFCRK